jgi:hypothetical protein
MKRDTHMPDGERRELIDNEESIGFLLSPSGMCVPSFI